MIFVERVILPNRYFGAGLRRSANFVTEVTRVSDAGLDSTKLSVRRL